MKLTIKKKNWSQIIVLSLLGICSILTKSIPIKAQNSTLSKAEQQVINDTCDEKVVLLGELPSHGEAKTFQAKARIVKELINKCGFEALIFEAPIYDFIGLHKAKAENIATTKQLDNAIGGFWTTLELKSWRSWLYSEFVEGDLYLGGLDDQVSATSEFARNTLPDLIVNTPNSVSVESCKQAIERNLFWRYDATNKYNSNEKKRLESCVKSAMQNHVLYSDSKNDNLDLVMLNNLANLYSRQRGNPVAMDRDEMMYRNLNWHIERLPKTAKIIIWTASVHASKQQGILGYKPMGTWLANHLKDSIAAIGFSAYSGQSSMAGMPIKTFAQMPPNSLEAITTKTDTSWVYLENSVLEEMGIIPSRLFGKITTANWSSYFDGVLVIREEIPPTFEIK